ncbi:MAG: hypothetical protein AAB625_02790 [Patescibacteria group bacterium]
MFNPDDDQTVQPIPQGGIQVGNGVMYPDLQGNLHPTAGGAINSNQGIESDFSRGASGGCNQDADRVPPPDFGGGGW